MEIIGAAALIAVGIVLAAVLYARAHPARSRIPLGAGAHPQAGAVGLRGGALRGSERRRRGEERDVLRIMFANGGIGWFTVSESTQPIAPPPRKSLRFLWRTLSSHHSPTPMRRIANHWSSVSQPKASSIRGS